MALRRRQGGGGMSRSSTFKEEKKAPPDEGEWAATSSLAAQAIAASTAHRHSTGGPTYDYTGMGSSNETGSFWGVLARKAKAILEDDNINSHPTDHHLHTQKRDSPRAPHYPTTQHSKKVDTPTSAPLASSMRDTIGRTLEESSKPTMPQETGARKIQIVRKGSNQGQEGDPHQKPTQAQPKNPTTQEDQLKASRDVAMATAAKAKLLLRELKTIKADLAFAKQRCSQLEEENRILRDARDKGVTHSHHDDDDMIRNQLETLLAEKARLAHENSVYARENRVLREIVEYHQLTSQDVIYVDEGNDEVAQVNPIFYSVSLPDSPTSPPEDISISLFRSASATAQLRFE